MFNALPPPIADDVGVQTRPVEDRKHFDAFRTDHAIRSSRGNERRPIPGLGAPFPETAAAAKCGIAFKSPPIPPCDGARTFTLNRAVVTS